MRPSARGAAPDTAQWKVVLCAACLSVACGERPPPPSPDASALDAASDVGGTPDAMTDVMTDAMTDVMTDAMTDAGSAPTSAFRLVSVTPETCPATGFDCSDWPPAAAGTISLVTSHETRAGRVLVRTAHVYVPARVRGRVPLVFYLHGGAPMTTTAALDQLARNYDELADGRPVPWRRNTAACQLSFPMAPGFLVRFEDSRGQLCQPPPVSVTSNQPMILVMPDGLQDDPRDPASTRGQHWEDGRVPSPGQIGEAEQRDDVGFIDHLIEVLAQRTDVDPERIGITGASNGGMMVQRLACHAEDPRTPSLRRVSAFAAQIATMPEPIHRGLSGRERCPTQGARPVAIAYFVGNGIDTAQCAVYGCSSPTINGDSRMPYGVPGGVYVVNSPDSGRVIAAEDSHRRWIDYAVASGGGAATLTTTTEGFFTSVRTSTFASSAARVVVYETRGGLHSNVYSRNDFQGNVRPLEFLLSFRRNAAGELRYEPAASAFVGVW